MSQDRDARKGFEPLGATDNVTDYAIHVSNLTVRYGNVTALDNLDLTVAAGRVTGLVGMNGAGKSTLFNAIMGAVPAASGTVSVAGLEPEKARALGKIAYVPQNEAVDWNFPVSVRGVVMMGRYGAMGASRRARSADKKAVAEALARTELTDLADRQIGQLSGGQRKRAFVARGIAQGASAMLLDEPFAGVDKRTEATLVELLRELAREGRTVFVSTHDLAALPQLADDVVLLFRNVIAQGPPAHVLTPAHLTRAFGMADAIDLQGTGKSEANG